MNNGPKIARKNGIQSPDTKINLRIIITLHYDRGRKYDTE